MARNVEAVNRIIALLTSDKSFNRHFRAIQAISVTDDCLKCRFQVTQPEVNSIGTLHGGFISSAVDFISSVDLAAYGHYKHVTVNLAIECHKPAILNSWIKVDSQVLNKGKRLAFCDVRFMDEESGKLLARGSHTKFLLE
ncbi:Acyl-coenzyme A thioesterase 13 [Clonorchis sinensis]|uniref:Acyl-coenzyme A thioesterase 13 n=2 Tax=Clonorchis sinensis TaxID=79923 RepID=A0A3R7FLA4_CLOSI|nr:Acyl-coenzyme A thioesterase 13 [Clonorchis sinensis]